MKIKGNGADRVNQTQPNPLDKVESAARESGKKLKKTILQSKDELSLSDNARVLAKASTLIAEMDGVRLERVAPLKQQIETGVYQVPYNQLAQILENRLVKF